MTVPRTSHPKQPVSSPTPAIGTTPPTAGLVLFHANDPTPGPDRCPCCGRPWFDPRASGLIDYVTLAQDVLADLKAALEEEQP
jgi:hypothetical protein